MLESLHVKNLALIEEAEVNFEKGLNILTGETGAGKSIILGSINMALGGKIQKDMIRNGAEYALIEMIFSIESEEQSNILKKMDIPVEDGSLIIQRKISNTRSSCRLNGETVSQKQIQEIADTFLDIHGQNDAQFLRNQTMHLDILDTYCEKELYDLKLSLKKEYTEYSELKTLLSKNNLNEEQKKREVSLLEYEINEIEDAHLSEGEDHLLEEKYRKMINSQKLAAVMNHTDQMLSNDHSEGASDLIERAARELRTIHGIDKDADTILDQILEIDSLLSDVHSSIDNFIGSLDYEEEEFNKTEERLNLINHLKDKYGSEMKDISFYLNNSIEKLEQLKDYDQYRSDLLSKYENKKIIVDNLCAQISQIRKKAALKFTDLLCEELKGLNFFLVQCEMDFKLKDNYSSNGYDEVAFMISLNPGERLKPLAEIASGGELSRIMLGIKSILAGQDQGKTFIFDEIDAGISGKTAWQVSGRLGLLSAGHQIICITHLAQIACMADAHFEIKKNVHNDVTTTTIKLLDETESIEEMSRLLGADVITDTVRENAKEMKNNAIKVKCGNIDLSL